MSYIDTKQALMRKLLLASIVSDSSIAYENKSFNPTGKLLWLAAYFIPATDDILGKTSASRNEQRGIFQISIFVKKNAEKFDNTQLTTIDSILTEFSYNSSATYGTQVVEILTSTVTTGRESESWFVRDVSINYVTYSTR